MRHGNAIYTSGFVGLDPVSGMGPGGVAAQTRQALSNIQAVLAAGGAELGDVVKITCFLTNIGVFAEFNEAYASFFDAHLPSRTTVGAVLAGEYLVEIDAAAIVGTALAHAA